MASAPPSSSTPSSSRRPSSLENVSPENGGASVAGKNDKERKSSRPVKVTTPLKGKSGRPGTGTSRVRSSESISSDKKPTCAAANADANIEEEVMKRRLYIEYQGDEAKILKLMKMVSFLSAEKFEPAPKEKVDSMHQNMKVLLRHLEFNAQKDAHAIQTLESSHGVYTALSEDIGVEIEKTRELITSLRNKEVQIDQERKVDKVLSAAKSVVQKLPTMKTGEAKIAEHQAKLQSSLKKKRDIVENIKKQVSQANKVGEELGALGEIFEKSKGLRKTKK